jgi:hypothetical protein
VRPRLLQRIPLEHEKFKKKKSTEKTNKANKVTVQGVSEPPSPVGVSRMFLGPPWRSSYDWSKDQRKVDSRASSRSEKVIGDLRNYSDAETGDRHPSTSRTGATTLKKGERKEDKKIAHLDRTKKMTTFEVNPFKPVWHVVRLEDKGLANIMR